MDNSKDLTLALDVVKKLAKIIRKEQVLFVENNLSEIDEVLKEKQGLIKEASLLEPVLSAINAKPEKNSKERALLGEIKVLLADCRELNLENSQLGTQRAKMVGRSIDFLESLLKIDSVKLYDQSGKEHSNTGKRNLGLA